MNGELSKCEKWKMWNMLLNALRREAGKPLVTKSNPYAGGKIKDKLA